MVLALSLTLFRWKSRTCWCGRACWFQILLHTTRSPSQKPNLLPCVPVYWTRIVTKLFSFPGSFPDRHSFPCRVPLQTSKGENNQNIDTLPVSENVTYLDWRNVCVPCRCLSGQRSTTQTLTRRARYCF